MSSQSDPPPPIREQNVLISSDIHPTLTFLFIIGMYTAIYPASTYIYLRSHQTVAFNKCIVIGTLTGLYFCLVIQTCTEWLLVIDVFVRHGDTRLSTFNEDILGESYSAQLGLLQLSVQWLSFLLADGLMLWRCYNACGRSLAKSAVPAILFVGETGLVVADTTLFGFLDTDPNFGTVKRARQINHVTSSLFCITSATSLSATFIICYSIYTHTRTAPNLRTRRRYRHIIDILVQSSAVYTTSVILLLIAQFLNTGLFSTSVASVVLDDYLSTFATCAAGIAPTIMVARLAVASSKDAPSVATQSDIETQADQNHSGVESNGILPSSEEAHSISETRRNQDYAAATGQILPFVEGTSDRIC